MKPSGLYFALAAALGWAVGGYHVCAGRWPGGDHLGTILLLVLGVMGALFALEAATRGARA